MYTYMYGTGIYHSLYRRIRFEDQLDHKDESRSREVGISGPSLPTLPWYKLPSGAVASVCGS